MGTFKLEKVKFLVYLIAPISAVYLFSIPAVHETIFQTRRYVVYKTGEDPEVKAAKDKAVLELMRKKRQFEREREAGASSAAGDEGKQQLQ